MNRRSNLLTIFLLLMTQVVTAQKLTVESMTVATNDISASQYVRKDLNGQPCALVKIQMVDDILRIEGNVIGDVVDRGTEKWVYLTSGTKEMKIVPRSHLPVSITFSKYGIAKLDGKATYSLILTEEVQGNDTPLILSTDGSKEVDLDEIANYMFGIHELKMKEKFKKTSKVVTAHYPQAEVVDDGKSKYIQLDCESGYDKTLLGQPLTAKTQWVSTLMVEVGTTSYTINLPTDKEKAIEAAEQVLRSFEAKGYKVGNATGIKKIAASAYEYFKIAKKKDVSMSIALAQVTPNNFILYIFFI